MPIYVDITTTFLGNTDVIPNSYAGAGGFVASVNVTEDGLEFRQIIEGNIMSNDFQSLSDRTQDLNSNSMTFINGKQFKIEGTVAPPLGQGSVDFKGSGTTSSNILYRMRDGGGTERIVVYGNGRQMINLNNPLALRITSNDYGLGVDGNGFATYCAPNINGVVTGHRIGQIDPGGVFREITGFISNQQYNQMRMQSVDNQVFNMINWQDHNGNIKFGYNPYSGQMEVQGLPIDGTLLTSGKVFRIDRGDGTSDLRIKN